MVTNFAISNFLNTNIFTFSFLFSFLNNYFSNDKILPTGKTVKILFILTKTIFHICVLSIHSGFKLLKYDGNSQVYVTCIAETPDILTEALKPGDQFVSIDGKKTYFDIGPSNAPTDGTYYCYYHYRFFKFYFTLPSTVHLSRCFLNDDIL